MAIALFFLVLFALVLVHEWGHFIVAKKTGMRVDEFGIGFPPKLFGIKKGGTEYTFNALPIGGFVRIYGENAADAAEDAAAGNAVEDSFTSKSKWAQAAVLVAGVTMNVLFAWVLFALALSLGVPTAVDEATAGDGADLMVQSVLPESPAAKAGLPVGAVITGVTVDGHHQAVTRPSDFRMLTESHEGVSFGIDYQTTGEEIKTISVTPTKGLVEDDAARAAIGVNLALVEVVREPIISALSKAGLQTFHMLKAITVGTVSLIAQSVLGTANYASVTGPVGIVHMVGDAAQFGLTSLLMFTAMISLNLAVINLLPFPALDGGRLLFVGIEAITRRPINPIWVARVNLVGFVLLMVLMIAVTYKDIVTRF